MGNGVFDTDGRVFDTDEGVVDTGNTFFDKCDTESLINRL